MSNLTVVDSFYVGPGNRFYGISDFEIYEINGQTYLIVAHEGSSDLKMYYVYPDQDIKLRYNLKTGDDTGTIAVNDLEHLVVDGNAYLITSGRYDDAAGLITISGNNAYIHSPTSITGDAENYSYFETSHTIYIEDRVFVLATKRNDNSLLTYRVQEDLQFKEKTPVVDSNQTYLGDISDFASVSVDGKMFILVASAFDAGLALYRMGKHGNLHLRATVAPTDQSGFSLVQVLETITIFDKSFVVMGAAGSDSITVYQVMPKGRLVEKDHVIDSLQTRFEGITELAIAELDGRAFVFASGSDDGLSVYEIMPDGTLRWVLDYEDDFEVALTNIGALKTAIIDGKIHVFVGSTVDEGFTQFVFEPDEIGEHIIGGNDHDVLVGTSGDDFLFGFRKGDYLYGGDGDDVLDGGNGKDYLTGGQGADTFVFQPDKRNDVVLDFEVGVDKIDLSAYALIGDLDDITIKAREYGAMVIIRGEKIRLEFEDSENYTHADLTADDFIF